MAVPCRSQGTATVTSASPRRSSASQEHLTRGAEELCLGAWRKRGGGQDENFCACHPSVEISEELSAKFVRTKSEWAANAVRIRTVSIPSHLRCFADEALNGLAKKIRLSIGTRTHEF